MLYRRGEEEDQQLDKETLGRIACSTVEVYQEAQKK